MMKSYTEDKEAPAYVCSLYGVTVTGSRMFILIVKMTWLIFKWNQTFCKLWFFENSSYMEFRFSIEIEQNVQLEQSLGFLI